ncbi:MAG: dynamin family protein [Actinomycetaceae bacterium]|nr:dynamin family protein [Actinomycetaceae bacterium]
MKAAAISDFRSAFEKLDFPLSAGARAQVRTLLDRLDDHILPRAQNLDAPLLAVVGGSTGVGKSTLVNALVGRQVAASSVIRPTTKRPLLLVADTDLQYFRRANVLPALRRVEVATAAPPSDPNPADAWVSLELRTAQLAPGLALIDAPDIDSVEAGNRELATQLMAAADLWIFVTSTARYADALPWQYLREAARQNLTLAVVLNRLPAGDRSVQEHLAQMLVEAGLSAPIFCVEEQPHAGIIETAQVQPLSQWLQKIAANKAARRHVAERALQGAIREVTARAEQLLQLAQTENKVIEQAHAFIDSVRASARSALDAATQDGTLLRGEVLARWQDIVGTSELFRGFEARVALFRDRLWRAWRGAPAPTASVEKALEDGLTTVIVQQVLGAQERIFDSWRDNPELRALVQNLRPSSDETVFEDVVTLVRSWQGQLLAQIRAEAATRKTTARVFSVGINILAVALMLVIFASTGGLTGLEMGVAGGAAVASQRTLEAIFGDQAVRNMAKKAKLDLLERMDALVAQYLADFQEVLPPTLPVELGAQATAALKKEWQ